MFVRGISEIAELLVSVKRLQEFLLNDEYQSKSIQLNYNYLERDKLNVALSLNNLTAKWNVDSSETALSDFNITLNKGELLGVIGPVGSGKSSTLQTILGTFYATTTKKFCNNLIFV